MKNRTKQTGPGAKPIWDSPAIAILCVFNFLLGAAAYKWVLWRIIQ